VATLPPVRLKRDGAEIVAHSREVVATFYRTRGELISLVYKGTELLASPLRPDFWRAPTDNDRGRNMEHTQGIWRHAAGEATVKAVTVEALPEQHAVRVNVALDLPSVSARWETRYTLYGSGDLLVEAHFEPGRPNLPSLPRLGMRMELPPGFDQITWLGRGPEETYADRAGARVDVYSGSVDGQFCRDYTKPGESGNKLDVRWVALTNAHGIGLLAVGAPLLSVNALHYTADDLQSALHPWELPQRKTTTLNLDLRQMGVGGDNSWGAWPHDAFLIPCTEQGYRFRLLPFHRPEGPAVLARTRF